MKSAILFYSVLLASQVSFGGMNIGGVSDGGGMPAPESYSPGSIFFSCLLENPYQMNDGVKSFGVPLNGFWEGGEGYVVQGSQKTKVLVDVISEGERRVELYDDVVGWFNVTLFEIDGKFAGKGQRAYENIIEDFNCDVRFY